MPANRSSSFRLTTRDLRLLEDLFWQRLMTSGHILRLGYFTSSNRCSRRLRQLAGAGLIERHLGAPLEVSTETVWTIAKQGKGLLLAQGIIDKSDVDGFNKAPSRTMSSHLLMLSEIRTRLHESGLLVKWIPEARCRHIYYVGERLRLFKPDGLAILKHGNGVRHVFIEADIGNNSNAQILAKLTSYENYRVEAFQETYADTSFDVWFVTISAGRAKILVRLARKSDLTIRAIQLAKISEIYS